MDAYKVANGLPDFSALDRERQLFWVKKDSTPYLVRQFHGIDLPEADRRLKIALRIAHMNKYPQFRLHTFTNDQFEKELFRVWYVFKIKGVASAEEARLVPFEELIPKVLEVMEESQTTCTVYLDDYAIHEELSFKKGADTKFFSAASRSTCQEVVIKKVPWLFSSAFPLVEEAFHQARCASRYVCPVLDIALIKEYDKYYVALVVLRMESDLSRDIVLRAQQNNPFSEQELVTLLRNLAEALDCAHSRGTAHQDIKPENVLCARGRYYLTDFGSVKSRARSLSFTVANGGTVQYMSPEAITSYSAGLLSDKNQVPFLLFPADMFALGLTGLDAALLRRSVYYEQRSAWEAAIAHEINSIPYSDGIKNIFRTLLQIVPEYRPTAVQLLRTLERLVIPSLCNFTQNSLRLSELNAGHLQHPISYPIPEGLINPWSVPWVLLRDSRILTCGGKGEAESMDDDSTQRTYVFEGSSYQRLANTNRRRWGQPGLVFWNNVVYVFGSEAPYGTVIDPEEELPCMF